MKYFGVLIYLYGNGELNLLLTHQNLCSVCFNSTSQIQTTQVICGNQ